MLQILSNGRKYSINELSNMLEVTPRMVRVYKEELEKAGIYIDTIRGPYGGYILNQHVSLPKEKCQDKLNMSEFDKKIYNITTDYKFMCVITINNWSIYKYRNANYSYTNAMDKYGYGYFGWSCFCV